MKIKAEVRRQKADLLALAMLVCALLPLAAPVAAQEPLGRLFFTPSQRSSLDVARSQRARTTLATEGTEDQAAPTAPQTITYGGMVRRSDGQSTVWINGRPVNDQQAAGGATVVGKVRADGSVTVEVPQSGRSVALRPGQSLELLSGTIEEGYSRKPVPVVPPEQKPETKAAVDDKKGGKPAPEDIARAEREREFQDQQRLQEAIQALRDAGTLKPEPQSAPKPSPLFQAPPGNTR